MTLTDEGYRDWWAGLSALQRSELFVGILERLEEDGASGDGYTRFVEDLKSRNERGLSLSVRQIASLHKWRRVVE